MVSLQIHHFPSEQPGQPARTVRRCMAVGGGQEVGHQWEQRGRSPHRPRALTLPCHTATAGSLKLSSDDQHRASSSHRGIAGTASDFTRRSSHRRLLLHSIVAAPRYFIHGPHGRECMVAVERMEVASATTAPDAAQSAPTAERTATCQTTLPIAHELRSCAALPPALVWPSSSLSASVALMSPSALPALLFHGAPRGKHGECGRCDLVGSGHQHRDARSD